LNSDFNYSGTELDAMSQARQYYAAISKYFDGHYGSHIVEVGAGVGTFSSFLYDRAGPESLCLLEPASNNFPVLRDRFRGHESVTVHQGYLEDFAVGLSADSLVAINVLEHVADEDAFLGAAREALRPGGTLLLFVPAVQSISGSLDKAFGHMRRYSKSSLQTRLSQSGFQTVSLRYFNLPGVLSWFIAGRVLRRVTISPREVRIFDRAVMPWLSKVERFWEPPMGQSLVVVARKNIQ